MPDINIGAITEALNDKEDRNLRNTDTGSGADAVIEYQAPDPNNNDTWYRKYASGWVEQGGRATKSATATNVNPSQVSLPVTMLNINYCIYLSATSDADDWYELELYAGSRTTTSFGVFGGSYNKNGNNTTRHVFCWEVKGMSAS